MANDTKQKTEIRNLIALESKRQGVPVELALALANQESGFNQKAKSSAGAIGVMQLMPGTAKSLGVNPNVLVDNIRGGIAYLRQMLERYKGDAKLALAAYNAGPGAVDKAKGVPNIAETKNYVNSIMSKVSGGVPTGAASGVEAIEPDPEMGEKLAAAQADYINNARAGIADYASQPYDPSLGLALRQQRIKELTDQFNRTVNETPMNLTPEQQQAIINNFATQSQAIQDVYNDAVSRIQGSTGENTVSPYEQKLREAYESQIARLQAANPYTRMAEVAPMQQMNPEDIKRLQDQKAVMDIYGRSRGLQPAYDWAALEQQKAMTDRAIRMANATGLTPEEFIQGSNLDYNQMSAALNTQNQILGNLYQRAMMGDQAALQSIAALAQNTQGNIVSNQANAYKALNDAQKLRLEQAKENAARRLQYTTQAQALDPYMVQGATQVQAQNIGTAGSMYNTGMNAGVNAGRNVVGYETAFIPGSSGQAAQDPNLIKPQQYGSTLLNAAAMTNDPNAFQNALDTYNAIAAQYGNFNPSFIPQSTVNTFRPNNN